MPRTSQSSRSEASAPDLAAEMTRLLVSGHAQAGMRLRSVRDLAVIFRVDPSRIGTALSILSERGVVVQRHGSGTYIRRLPTGNGIDHSSPLHAGLSAEGILAPVPVVRSRRRLDPRHKHLHFQIWVEFDSPSVSQSEVIDGARKLLAASGHRLTVCGDIKGIQSPRSGPKVVASLAARPADGYLVADWLGGLFDQAFTDTGKPWLMLGFAGPVRHQPCMLMDVVESVERATAILLEGGCRRVALIGHLGDKRTCDLMSLHHAFAMGFHGAAGYQVSRFVENQALPVRRALSEMLDSKTPPDGLYVADDTLLPFVAAELRRRGIVPGRDLAVITQWNENQTKAPELPWSRMVYSPRRFGEVLAGNLLATSQSAGVRLSNASILADWCPGETHLLARPATGRGKGRGSA